MNRTQSLFSIQDGVHPIARSDCFWFLLNRHYAKRVPSISYAYGLFYGGDIVGVCCFGTPASSSLRAGIMGGWSDVDVIELNRLSLLSNEKNQASMLVGASLKLLPQKMCVVSYADSEQGHIGYVYQAANFIYTGLSAKRTDWKVKGAEHLHGHTIADEFRGRENRAELMREKYGDDFYLEDRSRKHRYVYLVGSKTWRKHALKHLQYPICAYPKEAAHD